VLLVLAAPASAFGGAPPITVGDDFFLPDTVSPSFIGDTVTWEWDAGNDNQHNVVQDAKLFKSGAPTEVRTPFQISPSAGKFPYYCAIHGSKGGAGMSGVIRMAPEAFPLKGVQGAITFGVEWAVGTDTGNQFDVQYRIAGRDRWRDWKKNTAKQQGVFGKNGKPVTVKEGKTYEIRARSERSSNPTKKRSRWSPPLMILFV
jgi:hypothetical protein